MNRQDAIAEISKQIPDCEKCPLIVANCKKQGHYDGCMKQREAIKKAIEALSIDIIRCKDCKYSEHWYRDKSRCFLWHTEGVGVYHDGFCSYGCLPEIMTPPQGETNEKEK